MSAWLGVSVLLAVLSTLVRGEVVLESEYAEVRKGEFLAAQYQRAVALESEALQLAAAQRYKEANESLALSVRIHEQLLGQRHPQLLKPLLVAAENAAVWGSDLGMEGRPQVLHAMDLLNRGLHIISTAPHPTKEHMEEEAIRVADLMEVLEQMLAAISPPETLVSTARVTNVMPSLPKGIQTVSSGELVAGSLYRGKRWAFFAAPVVESWIHAQAQAEVEGQVVVYGIQTITTVSLMTHESRVSLHALVSAPGAVVATEAAADMEERKGDKACDWWMKPGCADSLSVANYTHSGGHGVGVGLLPNNPQNDAPMRFHFTDLPAEEGSVALMGARLSSAAPGVSYTFMLQVHAEPLIPLHIEEGVQNWELDGFRASIHYFTLAKGSELHSLEVKDLKCTIPSQERLLFGWGAVPNTGKGSLLQARRCVVSQPPGNSLLPPGGCWWEGAPAAEGATGEAGARSTMYVVVLNPCPDPTAYTVEARWGRDGTDRPPTPVPRQETSKPEEERSRKGEGGVCDSEGHCSLAGGGSDSGVWEESRLRKRFARQAMEGSFTPAAGRPHGLSAMDQPLPWYIQGVLMTGLLALGVGGLYLVARGRLGKVRNFGPPSQRRRPRPGSAAAASATGSLFRFPTWAELSGALPHREGEQDTGYELQLRRGRVSVSEVKRQPSAASRGAGDSSSPQQPADASSSAAHQEQRGAVAPSLTLGTLRSRQRSVSSGSAYPEVDGMRRAAALGAQASSADGGALKDERERSRTAESPAEWEKVLDMYLCPITQELMSDPVFASDGYTYERAAISKWIRKRRTSPMTNLPISSDLTPNLALRSAIRETVEPWIRVR